MVEQSVSTPRSSKKEGSSLINIVNIDR